MIIIPNDRDQEFEDLKSEIADQLDYLSENVDGETLEKINRFKAHLQKKYGDDSVEDNLERLNKVNRGLSYFERFKQSFERDLSIDPGRLMGLTDGIFGMVMTLLVFGIAIPELQIANYHDFISFITSTTPTIGITIVSFVLISSFWIYHHEFIKVNRLNIPYLWYNIFFLICISFMPFTTSLIGNYSHFFLSEVIFGLNIFLTLVSFLTIYRYAYNRGFLENKPSSREKKYIYNTFFIIMGLTVIVNLLDFRVSNNFIYLFLLVPVISTIRDIRFRMEL